VNRNTVRLVAPRETSLAYSVKVDDALYIRQKNDFADLIFPSRSRLSWNDLYCASSAGNVVLVA
jgi:hypothetical protein